MKSISWSMRNRKILDRRNRTLNTLKKCLNLLSRKILRIINLWLIKKWWIFSLRARLVNITLKINNIFIYILNIDLDEKDEEEQKKLSIKKKIEA